MTDRQVLAISCDRLQVQVPWSALRSRAVQVKVGKLRVQVAVHSCTDPAWAESLATSTAIANTQKPQEKREDEEQKSFRLSDVKVGVIDNFCISVASLHVLCAHAASSVSQPLFLDLLATGYGKPPSFPWEMVFRRWGVNDKKRPCQTWRLVLWNS